MGTCLRTLMENSSRFTHTVQAEAATVFVDFSAAAAVEKNIALAQTHGKPLVIGTTGHSAQNDASIRSAARTIPIFISANFSVGVALTIQMLQWLKSRLPQETKITLEETHHISKKDAPSGTALLLARPLSLSKESIRSHRVEKTEFSHEVTLSFGSETLTLKHESFSREVYAQGALKAAEFILDKPPGLYTMEDLIREKA